MKIRHGFVSNSSSASFTVLLSDLTSEQLYKIVNHIQAAKDMGIDTYEGDEWSLLIGGGRIIGTTIIDNFEMSNFLNRIGVTKYEYDSD